MKCYPLRNTFKCSAIMEFSINLSHYFLHDISIIRTNLLPSDFSGSSGRKRSCIAIVSEILNEMGQASAIAQNLQTPVTSSAKFSHSDQVIYLMISLAENSVVGFLKMGWKNLFIFDLEGSYVKRRCFCCLDFYIHEKKQRQGYGKRLFDFMLQDNHITPCSIPVDRPSEKLLKFLMKHYNLRTIIPQANNFMIYEQFFSGNIDCSEKMKVCPAFHSNQIYSPNSSCRTMKMQNCVKDQRFLNENLKDNCR